MVNKSEACINGVYHEIIDISMNITSSCMCYNDGIYYKNDLSLLRLRDCNMSVIAMKILYIFILIWSIISFIYVGRKISSSISIARLILVSQLFWVFIHVIFCSFQLTYEYKLQGVSLFLLNIIVINIMVSTYLVIYSFASTLYQMAEKSDLFIRKLMFLMWLLFGSSRTVVVLYAIINYNDPDNEKNDYGWNLWVSIFMLIVTAEIQVIVFCIPFFGLRIVSAIETLIQKTPENPNHIVTKQYLRKAKAYIKGFLPLGIPTTLGYGVLPTVYLATGNASYGYVCLMVIFLSHPQALISTVALATRQNKSNNNSVRQEQPAQNMDRNNQIVSDLDLASSYLDVSNFKSENNPLPSKYDSDI